MWAGVISSVEMSSRKAIEASKGISSPSICLRMSPASSARSRTRPWSFRRSGLFETRRERSDVIIGGGVSLIGEELFFGPIRRYQREYGMAAFAGLTDIVPAALGEEVVVHGALALARQKLGV